MTKPAALQENRASESDPALLCSFDYEAIQAPTRPLIHQAARFWFFRRGEGVLEIDGKPQPIHPGTLVAISPWQITEVTEVSEALSFEKVIYNYSYLEAVLKAVPGAEEEGTELLRFLTLRPAVLLDEAQSAAIERLLGEIREEFGVSSARESVPEKPMGRLYAAEKLIELMILYRRFADDLRAEDPAEAAGEGRAILRYLYTHSGEKLTLAGTAELFFLSESALSRQISKLTGTTFKRLLSGIRVEKAADYLLYTELTLNEIARLVGFVDASHLSRHFVAEMEVTPMNYRRIYAKTRGRSDRSEKATALALAEYVLQNYSDETLSAGRASERFDVSVTEMNRLLLYYAGRSFDALLHEVRINRACELLASTDFLILDVAVEVGYRNIKTFNLNFLKIKAMTPTQFRASVTLQKADGSETGRTGRRRGRDK